MSPHSASCVSLAVKWDGKSKAGWKFRQDAVDLLESVRKDKPEAAGD